MSTMFNTMQIRYWLHLFFILSQFIPISAQFYTIWSDDCDTKDHWTGGSVTNSPNCDTEPKVCLITSPSFGDLISDVITIPAYTGQTTLYLRYGIRTFFGSSPDYDDSIVVSCSLDSGDSWEHVRTYDNTPVDISGDTVPVPEKCQCVNCDIKFNFTSTGTHATDMAYIDNFSLLAKTDGGVVVQPIPTVNKTPTTTTTNTPTTNMPTTIAPTTNAPTTNAPTTSEPTTNAPTTIAPTTNAPTTNSPTTSGPTTNAPTTSEPTTSTPTTNVPTSASSTTQQTVTLTTRNPTTFVPTTSIPTTANPTSATPTTSEPTTSNPTTSNPTTSTPTTSNPTTSQPTTNTPTSYSPTTSNPTTYNPTTSNPTTTSEPSVLPTTSNPTTTNPTTTSTAPPTTTTTSTTLVNTDSNDQGAHGRANEIDNTNNANGQSNGAGGLNSESTSIDDMLNYIIFALIGVTLLLCGILMGYFCTRKKKAETSSKASTDNLERYITNSNESLEIEIIGDDIIKPNNTDNLDGMPINAPVINNVPSKQEIMNDITDVVYSYSNNIVTGSNNNNNKILHNKTLTEDVELQLEGTYEKHKKMSTLMGVEGDGALITGMNKYGTLESQSGTILESENMDYNQYAIPEFVPETGNNNDDAQSDDELDNKDRGITQGYQIEQNKKEIECMTPDGDKIQVELGHNEFVVHGDDEIDYHRNRMRNMNENNNGNDDAQSDNDNNNNDDANSDEEPVVTKGDGYAYNGKQQTTVAKPMVTKGGNMYMNKNNNEILNQNKEQSIVRPMVTKGSNMYMNQNNNADANSDEEQEMPVNNVTKGGNNIGNSNMYNVNRNKTNVVRPMVTKGGNDEPKSDGMNVNKYDNNNARPMVTKGGNDDKLSYGMNMHMDKYNNNAMPMQMNNYVTKSGNAYNNNINQKTFLMNATKGGNYDNNNISKGYGYNNNNVSGYNNEDSDVLPGSYHQTRR